MSARRQVRPQLLPGAIYAPGSLRTNGFTLGRDYDVVGFQGACLVVRNDNGHERCVVPDGSPCAHVVSVRKLDGWPYETQNVVGCFVESGPGLREPNNLRNRYRRYRAAWRAYNWSGTASFRDWAKNSAPDSYFAPAFAETFASLLPPKKKRAPAVPSKPPMEADEVASNLPPLRRGASLADARERARSYLPNESVTLVDEVAEALWRAASSGSGAIESLRRSFATEAEAIAFVAGVEFVNDSAIEARREGCVVVIDDEDAPR